MKLNKTEINITTSTTSLTMKLKSKAFNIKTDAMIAGKVNKSPNAAIIGLVILSGSQPCSKLLNETNIVIGSIIKLEINPAIVQINIKSIMLIDGEFNKIQNIFATIPKNMDKTRVKTNEEKILLFKSSENLNFGEIKPMCKLVDNLDANDPKIFPLIPIAPGMTTNKPGNVSRKNVILPKIIPAIKSPIAQIQRAIKPSLII